MMPSGGQGGRATSVAPSEPSRTSGGWPALTTSACRSTGSISHSSAVANTPTSGCCAIAIRFSVATRSTRPRPGREQHRPPRRAQRHRERRRVGAVAATSPMTIAIVPSGAVSQRKKSPPRSERCSPGR
jgi:hypothetical protein